MKHILSVNEMRCAEQQLINQGITELSLINRAIEGLIQNIMPKKTIVVCGKGNNGSDGLGVALKLNQSGADVSVILLSKKHNACGMHFLSQLSKADVEFIEYKEGFDFSIYEQVIDAIIGTGFFGELTGVFEQVVNDINKSAKFVISIDIPSGLNGDNGLCKLAVKSNLNLAVGGLKCGLLLNKAKDYIKQNKIVEIGININSNVILFENSDCKPMLAERLNFSNKGNYGKVGILGGCLEYSGAPKLSAMAFAMLRSGCGVSRLIIPNCIVQGILPYITSQILFFIPSKNGCVAFDPKSISKAIIDLDSLVFGMGLSLTDEVAKILEYILLNFSLKLIIDADGINALSKLDKNILKNTKCKVAITPHIMEFSRLTNIHKNDIIKNPIECVKSFAYGYNIVVLLKGATTVVSDGNIVYLVDRGCAGMATAGSGDVLDGILGGLLGWNELNAKTLCLGAYINGKAGELASCDIGEISLTATDTISYIDKAIKAI